VKRSDVGLLRGPRFDKISAIKGQIMRGFVCEIVSGGAPKGDGPF